MKRKIQFRSSKAVSFFDKRIKKAYQLFDYQSVQNPTIFHGVHSKNDVEVILKHKGPKIVYWSGRDVRSRPAIRRLRNCRHIAQSDFILRYLKMEGINDIQQFVILTTDIDLWKPKPLGDEIYWYKARGRFYGSDVFRQIRDRVDIKFITPKTADDYSQEEMLKIYQQCFCGVRPVRHDGCSKTVLEMGLMGRKVIWNGSTPNAVHYKTVDDIFYKIKELQRGYDYKKVAEQTFRFCKYNEKLWTDLLISF